MEAEVYGESDSRGPVEVARPSEAYRGCKVPAERRLGTVLLGTLGLTGSYLTPYIRPAAAVGFSHA